MSAVLRGDKTSAGGGTTGAIATRGARVGMAGAGGAAAFATTAALGFAVRGVFADAIVDVLGCVTGGVLALATAGAPALGAGGALTTGGVLAIGGALAIIGDADFATCADDGARAATRGAGLGRDAAATSAGVGTCDGCANISVSSPSFARSWVIRAP
jgi:hypothetical protein